MPSGWIAHLSNGCSTNEDVKRTSPYSYPSSWALLSLDDFYYNTPTLSYGARITVRRSGSITISEIDYLKELAGYSLQNFDLDVIEVSSPVLHLLLLRAFVVVFLQHIRAYIHPLGYGFNRNFTPPGVRDCSFSERVGRV